MPNISTEEYEKYQKFQARQATRQARRKAEKEVLAAHRDEVNKKLGK